MTGVLSGATRKMKVFWWLGEGLSFHPDCDPETSRKEKIVRIRGRVPKCIVHGTFGPAAKVAQIISGLDILDGCECQVAFATAPTSTSNKFIHH